MPVKSAIWGLLAACAVTMSACTTSSQQAASMPSQPINLLASGAFTDAHAELKPTYERAIGSPVNAVFGSSVASVSTSVPARLQKGENADVVLIAKNTLNDLVKQGWVEAGTEVDLMSSSIGLAVREGAPMPTITTVEEFKQTLLKAKSIAYSSSLSGVYYENELLKKLGIEAEVLPKSRKVVGEKVGQVIARGEAEVGIQQVSELIPIRGIQVAGKIPESIQQTTIMSAGLSAKVRDRVKANALLKFYKTSPQAHQAFKRNGLEPVTP